MFGFGKKKFGPIGEKGTGRELVINRADNCVRGELNYVRFTREAKQMALAEMGSI